MIVASAFADKMIAVFGLARSGLSVTRALAAAGARVHAWDDNVAAVQAASGEGLTVTNLHTSDFAGFDGLVVSPGIPLTHPQPHPLVVKAQAAGVPVFGDIEIFAKARPDLPSHSVVAITGTNGKSTTAALIHHVLASAGLPALLGGNIGIPILSCDPLPSGGIYVLEVSSFQIDLTQSLAADVAVLTNISPDHLDRHGSMAGYVAAKARLFAMQRPDQVAVIATDDADSQAVAQGATAPVIRVAARDPLPGNQADWPSLQGIHNAQNAALAFAACRALGLEAQTILAGFATYPGLPHRMERVATIGGVLYVNDSKATNATSTAPALSAYPVIHWIVGGKRKTDELDACLPHLGHVRAAYVIGEASDLFEQLLSPHVPVVRALTLDAAFSAAAVMARPGEVVLLSPACASYDQFKDYEDRGQAFRTLVMAHEGSQA
jgi:UDP-N-acetylmuramoylalanine--D-glutamate ligase